MDNKGKSFDGNEKYLDGCYDIKQPFHVSPMAKRDAVNSPAHYTNGSQEAIVTIEEAIEEAPSMKAGFLHGQAP